MGDITPIIRGAKYRETDDEDPDRLRVRSVWIDEDRSVQVSLLVENAVFRSKEKPTVSMEDFISRIENGEIIRVNSDHEAWEYRNK